MKFSVIIPLYNKAPYIHKALESVFAQTYTDYELIVVDDGSTDDSAKIAQATISQVIANSQSPIANRLSLLMQANQGVSAARNNGVAHAQGDYLAFLDADDWWESTYLERMAQLINDYPDAGLYACNYMYYKPGKTRVALDLPTGYINYPKTYYEGNAMPVWTGATIIPKQVFKEMGGFPLGIKLGEDFLLWAKIAMQHKVAFLNEPLTWYNNDVPAALRATRNLHKPEEHMLFNLEAIGTNRQSPISNNQSSFTYSQSPIANSQNCQSPISNSLPSDWSRLFDKLRVNGLLEYWLSDAYRDAAAIELAKVDWSQQQASVKRMYKTPIWILRLKRWVIMVGSAIKQRIIRLITK